MNVNGESALENLMKDGKMSLKDAKEYLETSVKEEPAVFCEVCGGLQEGAEYKCYWCGHERKAIYGKSPVQEAIDSLDKLNENELEKASVDLNSFGSSAIHINQMGCAKRVDPEEGLTLTELAKRSSGGLDDIIDALSQKNEFWKELLPEMEWQYPPTTIRPKGPGELDWQNPLVEVFTVGWDAEWERII